MLVRTEQIAYNNLTAFALPFNFILSYTIHSLHIHMQMYRTKILIIHKILQ